MYERHFGLREQPFSLTPDTGYFIPLGTHREALTVLRVALEGGEGFIKVVGEVGTGKTMLCRKLLNTLGPAFVTAYLPNPFFGPQGICLAVAQELGVEDPPVGCGLHHLVERINQRVLEIRREGGSALLIIDEAQSLPTASLEAIRLLTNLESETRKLLQVVLFGQPELDVRLSTRRLRQVQQRVSFSADLDPLSAWETRGYVAHRLSVAGRSGDVPFTRGAMAMLHRASGGIPRIVNLVAHKSLMCAYGEGEPRVRSRHVRRAIIGTDCVRTRRPRWLSLPGIRL